MIIDSDKKNEVVVTSDVAMCGQGKKRTNLSKKDAF